MFSSECKVWRVQGLESARSGECDVPIAAGLAKKEISSNYPIQRRTASDGETKSSPASTINNLEIGDIDPYLQKLCSR